jgi:hypothetical protein
MSPVKIETHVVQDAAAFDDFVKRVRRAEVSAQLQKLFLSMA